MLAKFRVLLSHESNHCPKQVVRRHLQAEENWWQKENASTSIADTFAHHRSEQEARDASEEQTFLKGRCHLQLNHLVWDSFVVRRRSGWKFPKCVWTWSSEARQGTVASCFWFKPSVCARERNGVENNQISLHCAHAHAHAHATCNMQHATCNMQHATCNMQHATCTHTRTHWSVACHLRQTLNFDKMHRKPTKWVVSLMQKDNVGLFWDIHGSELCFGGHMGSLWSSQNRDT